MSKTKAVLEKEIAELRAQLEQQTSATKKSSTKKKISATKIVVDNLTKMSGLTLAIGHPRKYLLDSNGKQLLDERGYAIPDGENTSREYITLGVYINYKSPAGVELSNLARAVGGRIGKGRYDNRTVASITFPQGICSQKARKTVEKVLGRKIQQ